MPHAQWADMLFGAASSEDSNGSSSSEEEDEEGGTEVDASSADLAPAASSVVNLSSPSPSPQVAVHGMAEDDDEIQILTAAEAAAEVAEAARRAVEDPNAASRKRKRPRVETRAEPTECTICCEDCTKIGRHRLVALKCGHLFGRKCIERWISEKRTCPICSAGVRRADICLLFSDHVAVVDNAGLEDMTKKFEEEKVKNNKLETEMGAVKQQLETKTKENAKLQADLTKFKKFYVDLRYKLEQRLQASNSQTVPAASAATNTPVSVTQSQPNSQVATSPIVFAPARVPGVAVASSNQVQGAASASAVPARNLQTAVPLFSYARVSSVQLLPPAATQAHGIATAPLFPAPSTDAFAATVRKYKPIFDAPLLSARVFSIAQSCRFVCIGEKLSQDSHGIMMLMSQGSSQQWRIPIHTSDVRDIAIHRSENLVLTVAFDGKMVVTSLREKKAVQQVEFPSGRRQGWSCGFSKVEPHAVYCGFQDGSVAKYDMRKPVSGEQGIVQNFTLPERQPVHSIKLFRDRAGSNAEGLAAATFRGLSVWKDVTDAASVVNRPIGNGSVGATPFSHAPSDQACFSLASNQLSPNQVVMSARSIPTKHSVFDLQTIARGQFAPRTEFAGHKAPSVMCRSAMWSEADGTSVVASWSHDVERVTLWNVANHREARGPDATALSVARVSMPVVDIQHAVANGNWGSGTALLGTMTSRQLCMYRAGS